MAALELDAPPAARLPAALHRQQLARLSVDGWSRVLAAAVGRRARAPAWACGPSAGCRWSSRASRRRTATCWPPGCRRRLASGDVGSRWRSRRAMCCSSTSSRRPTAVTRLLPRSVGATWRALLAKLAANDCAARVYGGYGWQALTRHGVRARGIRRRPAAAGRLERACRCGRAGAGGRRRGTARGWTANCCCPTAPPSRGANGASIAKAAPRRCWSSGCAASRSRRPGARLA